MGLGMVLGRGLCSSWLSRSLGALGDGRMRRAIPLPRRLFGLLAACGVCLTAGATGASAANWHLQASFGLSGVARLPVRERLQEEAPSAIPVPPERDRSLLAAGPAGSVLIGGYAKSRPGVFLLARLSAKGALDRGFGRDGVLVVPGVHWFHTDPPRLVALADGGVLVVGLNGSDQLAAVRIGSQGTIDRSFGHGGVAAHALARSHRFTIVTAATIEPDGDLLAVYQKELPQPVNQPRVPEGQGNGSIDYVRLLRSGALDSSFGADGFLTAEHPEVHLLEGESGTVGACAEALSPGGSLLIAYEWSGIEELGPNGALQGSFAVDPIPSPKGYELPAFETKNGFHLCQGLAVLPDGSIEGAEGRRVARLTVQGTPDTSFGTSGVATVGSPPEALAVAPDGETFAVWERSRKLVVAGILANGQPDPALGGVAGESFPVELPLRRGPNGDEPPSWELLAKDDALTVRMGEQLIRLSD
jgi:uncharacterized delta-60 repeat protein